jgi:hypothetical protein
MFITEYAHINADGVKKKATYMTQKLTPYHKRLHQIYPFAITIEKESLMTVHSPKHIIAVTNEADPLRNKPFPDEKIHYSNPHGNY